MLNKTQIENLLSLALSKGADFSEVFIENSNQNKYIFQDKKVKNIESYMLKGIGIRIIKGFKSVYVSTNEFSMDKLKSVILNASSCLSNINNNVDVNLNKTDILNISPFTTRISECDIKSKLSLLKEMHDTAFNYSNFIKMVDTSLFELESEITIANSDGLYKQNDIAKTRIYVTSIANDGMKNQSISENIGKSAGFEIYKDINIMELAEKSAKSAVTMLNAKSCPAGKMPVAIENGFGGVIFHEACGHSLEGEQIAQDNSEFCGMLNKKIANKKVTAIDNGKIKNAWGSINIDDEGNEPQKNVLIENGILKNYMLDNLNAKKLGMKSTGNARRQNYMFAPTSRMTNTYIDNGKDKREDIIKSIDYGIYAKKMGGGQVNTITGDFNFNVAEAYLIKNGEIQHPVCGASLIGKGSEILNKIEMVSDNLELSQGLCGSVSGVITANVGQPLIKVSEITVGGSQ